MGNTSSTAQSRGRSPRSTATSCEGSTVSVCVACAASACGMCRSTASLTGVQQLEDRLAGRAVPWDLLGAAAASVARACTTPALEQAPAQTTDGMGGLTAGGGGAGDDVRRAQYPRAGCDLRLAEAAGANGVPRSRGIGTAGRAGGGWRAGGTPSVGASYGRGGGCLEWCRWAHTEHCAALSRGWRH